MSQIFITNIKRLQSLEILAVETKTPLQSNLCDATAHVF